MSIARAAAVLSRSFRTLMFPAAVRLLPIKDLKDLRALLCRRFSIDMQVLKDLKRCFSRMRVFRKSCRLAGTCAVRERVLPNYRDEKFAGDRPPRYGKKGFSLRSFRT